MSTSLGSGRTQQEGEDPLSGLQARSGGAGNTWVIVLAAGEGRRLRGFRGAGARAHVPKQFWSPGGRTSMLRWAIGRATNVAPPERVLCVVAASHREWWEPELQDIPRRNVLVQPENRGTAPGLLLPLLRLRSQDPEARVVVLPSDHFVADEATLSTILKRGIAAAGAVPSRVMLLGMKLDAVDSGYGWVLPDRQPAGEVRTVRAFVEKPRRAEATRLLRQGALVNSFMAVAHVRGLIRLYESALPDLLRQMEEYLAAKEHAGDSPQRTYERLPAADFSRDLLQALPHHLALLAVPPCGWTDLGTPPRLRRHLHQLRARAPLTLAPAV